MEPAGREGVGEKRRCLAARFVANWKDDPGDLVVQETQPTV